MNTENSIDECRYCRESDPIDDLIKPCVCNSLVHRSCLNIWLDTRVFVLDKKCEVCLNSYIYAGTRSPRDQLIYDWVNPIFQFTVSFMSIIVQFIIAPTYSAKWIISHTCSILIAIASYHISYIILQNVFNIQSEFTCECISTLVYFLITIGYYLFSRTITKLSKMATGNLMERVPKILAIMALITPILVVILIYCSILSKKPADTIKWITHRVTMIAFGDTIIKDLRNPSLVTGQQIE